VRAKWVLVIVAVCLVVMVAAEMDRRGTAAGRSSRGGRRKPRLGVRTVGHTCDDESGPILARRSRGQLPS
jgi:hypothetical protein